MWDNSFSIQIKSLRILRKHIRNRYIGIERALEIMVKSKLIPTNAKYLHDFSKTCNNFSVTKVSIYRNKSSWISIITHNTRILYLLRNWKGIKILYMEWTSFCLSSISYILTMNISGQVPYAVFLMAEWKNECKSKSTIGYRYT